MARSSVDTELAVFSSAHPSWQESFFGTIVSYAVVSIMETQPHISPEESYRKRDYSFEFNRTKCSIRSTFTVLCSVVVSMEELRRELFYETHKHQLGRREVSDFFKFLDSSARFDDAIQFFVSTWETLIELIPKTHATGEVEFPAVDCIHCDEPVYFRDDGENVDFLWVHQGRQKSLGIEPLPYCPLPYYVVARVIDLHPDWMTRLRSACSVCNEELTFPTNHRCLVPEWIKFTIDGIAFLGKGKDTATKDVLIPLM